MKGCVTLVIYHFDTDVIKNKKQWTNPLFINLIARRIETNIQVTNMSIT